MTFVRGDIFDQIFYDSYNENFPLHDGWQERIDICNLYPLLVHVNLFGGGYYNQTKNIIEQKQYVDAISVLAHAREGVGLQYFFANTVESNVTKSTRSLS